MSPDELVERMLVLISEAKICQAVNRQDELSVTLDLMSALIDEFESESANG